MTVLSSPVAHWHNEPISVGLFGRIYWTYDAPSSTWTITTNRFLERGRLADLTGTGVFTLEPLASIPSIAPVLSMTRRPDGTVHTYRATA